MSRGFRIKGLSRMLAIFALELLVLVSTTPASAGRLPPVVLPSSTNPHDWEVASIHPLDLTSPPPIVLPPSVNPYGASYNEWGARWWQWVLDRPIDQNPIDDATGALCAIGQSGPVWFLVGGVATRTCALPGDKALFFPVATEAYILTEPSETPQQARDIIKGDIDTTFAMRVDVDGTSIPNPESYRTLSPALGSGPETFIVNLPDGWGVPAGPYQTVADGFYVMLAPLSTGTHDIRIRSQFYVYPEQLATVDAQYTLTILPPVVYPHILYLPLVSR
jgi:hypothetical protein